MSGKRMRTEMKKKFYTFDLFSLPKVMKTLAGRSLGGMLTAVLPGASRSTVDRWLEDADERLLQKIEEVIPPEIRELRKENPLLHGAQLCGFLLPHVYHARDNYKRTFSLLSKCGAIEHFTSGYVTGYSEKALIGVLWGLQCGADESIGPEKSIVNADLEPSLLEDLEKQRSSILRDMLLRVMVAFDVDAFSSLFPEYCPRMMFFAVIPEMDEKAIRPHMEKPARRFIELLYCVAMDVEVCPPLDKMIADFDTELAESVRGKLERGTMTFPDFQRICQAWLDSGKVAGAAESPFSDEQRWELAVVFYVATQILAVLFQPVAKLRHGAETIKSFHEEYYVYWQRELERRGLDEMAGRSWGDRPLTRALANSYVIKGRAV